MFDEINKIQNDTIILTFIDKKYLPIFDIFYGYFEKLNLDNLLVISLDDFTYNNLISRNINSVLIEYNLEKKNLFWEFRFDIINQIFKLSKKNIIHTDSDCFWLKNICEIITNIEYNSYDIIGSIAYGMPINVVKKLGFVLCCGFYYVKYNDNNVNILDKIINQKINNIDDQVLFNTYILNNNTNIIDIDSDPILCKKIIMSDNIQIGILKNNIISRNYMNNLYCFHPYLQSSDINIKITEIKRKLKN